jgi:hypothetical protein
MKKGHRKVREPVTAAPIIDSSIKGQQQIEEDLKGQQQQLGEWVTAAYYPELSWRKARRYKAALAAVNVADVAADGEGCRDTEAAAAAAPPEVNRPSVYPTASAPAGDSDQDGNACEQHQQADGHQQQQQQQQQQAAVQSDQQRQQQTEGSSSMPKPRGRPRKQRGSAPGASRNPMVVAAEAAAAEAKAAAELEGADLAEVLFERVSGQLVWSPWHNKSSVAGPLVKASPEVAEMEVMLLEVGLPGAAQGALLP